MPSFATTSAEANSMLALCPVEMEGRVGVYPGATGELQPPFFLLAVHVCRVHKELGREIEEPCAYYLMH